MKQDMAMPMHYDLLGKIKMRLNDLIVASYYLLSNLSGTDIERRHH